MNKVKALHKTICLELKEAADPIIKQNYEKYFKQVIKFHGLKTPSIDKIAKKYYPQIMLLNASEIKDISFALLASPYAEEKAMGIRCLNMGIYLLDSDFMKSFTLAYDAHVYDWGTCDSICGRVLKYLLIQHKNTEKELENWSKSNSLWRTRASAVAYVNHARHGNFNKQILINCQNIVTSDERFVQLGMGWVLRELYLADKEITLAFLRKNYEFISREGLRYAIEKMPVNLQKKLLDEHKALT